MMTSARYKRHRVKVCVTNNKYTFDFLSIISRPETFEELVGPMQSFSLSVYVSLGHFSMFPNGIDIPVQRSYFKR